MSKFINSIKGLKFTGTSIIAIALTAVLLIATIVVAVMGFSAPSTVSKTSTLVSYSLQGSFSQQAYGYQTGEVCLTCQTDLVYFPAIIESATGAYTYEFLSDEAASDVKTTIQISAILSRAGYWTKTIELLPSQELTVKTVTFPLDTKGYLDIAKKISEELGLSKTSNINVVLSSNVHTEATIGGAVIEDNFIQTCDFSLSDTLMEWTRPLDLARKGYQANKAYEQRGNFGYTITLLPNSLYTSATLESPSPAVLILRRLTSAASYASDKIDRMNVNFTYNVVADNPVSDISHEVEAIAILSNPDGAQVVFPLIDAQQFTGDLTVELPIDVSLLYDVIKKMENTTTNNFATTYNLVVKVNVHTGATSPGLINETVSAVLPMTLTSDNLQIGEATGNTKTGSITSTTEESNSARSTLLLVALSLLGLTILAGLWTVYQYMESQRTHSIIHELWENTQQTVVKHKDIFVDVVELPPLTETDKVMQIGTLPELVKLADSLLKPILHQKDQERHIYCVIDNNTRYVYVIVEPPPREAANP